MSAAFFLRVGSSDLQRNGTVVPRAPVPPARAALHTDVMHLRLLAALHADVGRLRLPAALHADIERRLPDEARARSKVAGDFSAGARAEREALSDGVRPECAARTHGERMQ